MEAWTEYFRDDLNIPSRADHYIMQLTEYTRFKGSDGSLPFDSNRQRIEFDKSRPLTVTRGKGSNAVASNPDRELTEEEIRKKHREQAKMMLAQFGGPASVKGGDKLLIKIAEQEIRDGQRA